MTVRGRIAMALALVAGALLVAAPLLSMATADPLSQTMTLFTALGALIGFVGVVTVFEGRATPSTAALGLGTAAGALGAPVMFRLVGLLPSGASVVFWTQLLVMAPLVVAGAWMLVFAIRRVAPAPARPGVATALVFTGVTVIGPAIMARTPWAAHNLSALSTTSVIHYWTVGAALLVAPALALTTLPGDWFERWWDAATSRVMAIPARAFAIGVTALGTALALGFAFYCFDGKPTTSDEIAQLWHARALLSGRLFLPPDPNPEFFAIDNLIDRPVWMSQFPIGGPVVLALGLAIGAAWLVNPLFTGLTALNVYLFAKSAYGEAQARAAAVVFIASPMVLIMGGSQMNHAATAWLVTAAIAALPRWLRAPDQRSGRRWAAVMGLAIGAAATIRPLDAAIAAVVIGGVMAYDTLRDPSRAASIGVAAAAGAVPVTLLLLANWRTTGAPFQFAYQLLWGPNHSLGLHPDPTGLPHTAWRALMHVLRYTTEVNWYATTWPVPVLLIIAIAFAWSRRVRSWDLWLAGFFGLQLAAYSFYWHDGQFAGPRFLYSAIPAVLILAARAPFVLSELFPAGSAPATESQDPRTGSRTPRRVILALLPVCIGAAWIRPMAPFGVQGIALEYRVTREGLKRDAPPDTLMARLPRSLVFVQEGFDARLARRLWALGVSRGDAARLLRDRDACLLLDAIRVEENALTGDTTGRTARLEAASVGQRSGAPGDPPVSEACAAEAEHDGRIASAISFGPMLLRNELDELGRVAGRVVYVMDLRDRNELLRARFGDREWYRWEIPAGSADSVPVLVPYRR